jgi:hypothetical protein
VLGLSTPANLVFYLIPELAGGAAAAVVFRLLDMGNDKATTATPSDQAKLQQAGAPGPH